jgi:hypothetical protein
MRKNTVIDVTAVQNHEQDLTQFCLANSGMPVLDAFNNILGAKK